MIILTESQKLQYELSNVARLFFPAEDIRCLPPDQSPPPDDAVVRCAAERTPEGACSFTVTLLLPGQPPRTLCTALEHQPVLGGPVELGKLLYRLLEQYTGRTLDWGVLTGIRPVKLARKLRLQGKSEDEVEAVFTGQYLTTPQKARLCRITDSVQRPVLESTLPGGYSLYISIPFCPSRCSYCSFVSHSTEKSLRMIPAYLEKLCLELEDTARLARAKGLTLQTAYMGGGTPSILTAGQLEQVLSTVRRCFDMTHCAEFTVEAGRPDTITPDKLEVLRRYGVDRISVNCQTLSDEILHTVGRNHTAQEFFDAFSLVKTYAFTAINVDLIAGLPGDTPETFRKSLEQVIALGPQNITVHTLTVKRAAGLRDEKQTILGGCGETHPGVTQMVDLSQWLLEEQGYQPYYLYRQKGTVDSLENVGFSLPGYEGRYNIFIMDETHTILSVGGGGVTKLVLQGGEGKGSIQRIFNFKYPYEYLERFDILLEKKQAIAEFPL